METNKSDECDVMKTAVTCAMTKGKEVNIIPKILNLVVIYLFLLQAGLVP